MPPKAHKRVTRPEEVLAIFDFCQTIASFHTADEFVWFVQKELGKHLLLFKMLLFVLNKGRLLYGGRRKRLILRLMRGISMQTMDELAQKYHVEKIIPSLNREVIAKIHWHQEQKHTLIIVSGGYAVYIRKFATMYNFLKVVANELANNGERYNGEIAGLDCMGENKLYKLQQVVDLEQYNLAESYAYSDDASDIPLLSLVGNPYVISFGQNIQWATALEYDILTINNGARKRMKRIGNLV